MDGLLVLAAKHWILKSRSLHFCLYSEEVENFTLPTSVARQHIRALFRVIGRDGYVDVQGLAGGRLVI